MSRSRSHHRQRTTALLSATLLIVSAGVALVGPTAHQAAAAPPEPGALADSGRLETYRSERPVAPGVTLTSFDEYGPDALTGEANWLQGSLLTAELGGDVRMERIFPGEVAKREELTTQANRAGAIAAINSSYFDISNSGAPWGVSIQDGEMLQSPHIDDPKGACADCSVMVTEDGMAKIGEILFEGTVNLPGGTTVKLDAINKPDFQIASGIMAFTPVWGSYTRDRPVSDTDQKIEVVITDGKVASTSTTPGEGKLPEGTFTLVARGESVASLENLAVGDPVSIDYDFRSADDQKIRAAASGRQLLVIDGVPQKPRVNSSDPQPHPRTAVGFSRDGKKMFMLTVDGRQPEFSTGLTLDELAVKMVELGAYNAINFDGGGSTTLVAREPGSDVAELVNRPSEFDDDEVRPGDFSQRPVPDGLGLFIPEGSGELDGFWLETAVEPRRAAGPDFAPLLRTDRVFPNLSRKITAAPYDEMYSPAKLDGKQPTWRSSDRSVGTVDADGVFTAAQPGQVKVSAGVGDISGELGLTVLSELARIKASTPTVDLGASNGESGFDVIGLDARGYTAPIEPTDVTVDYDDSVLDIAITDDGQFTVTADPFSGTQSVQITVDGHSTTLPVTYPQQAETEEVVVDDFEGIDDWDVWTLRAQGSWTSTADGVTGKAGQLDYDFTQSNETRGIGIWPADGFFPVEGKPTEFRLRVNSDPIGMRVRMEIMDARGVLRTVEPGFIEQSGWQEIVYPVPADVLYPIKLRRIYFNEIKPTASYQGTTILDQLTAIRPVEHAPEQQAPATDPVVSYGTATGPGPWQFGVISQAGVSAADPDGPAVQQARTALSDLRNRGVDLVLVDSGFVAEANPENFQLAKEILDSELPGIDYHYQPGKAELADGDLADFTAVFGEPDRVLDHRKTRFLLLDTSQQSYHASDWQQLPLIREQLDAVAKDSNVKSVVVVQSAPLQDQVHPDGDQLNDPKEAATVEEWLTDFQERSGKAALFVGADEATFSAQRVDGVAQLTNGAVNRTAASGVPYGGFAGWSLVDVGGQRDFAAEFVPQADELIMNGPKSVAVGAAEKIATTVVQGDAQVPAVYPMGVFWKGSEQLWIGPADQAGAKHRAAYDPATGELTGLRPGEVTLTAKAGTQSASIKITIG